MHHRHSIFSVQSQYNPSSVSKDFYTNVRSCLSDPNLEYFAGGELFRSSENNFLTKHIKDADGDRASLTNSRLEKLEVEFLKDIPEDIKNCKVVEKSSLDSHVKGVKNTLEKIFNSFYENLHDFDLYKERFNEIVARNDEDSYKDMKVFVKDLIQNILMSELAMSGSVKGDENPKLLARVHSIIKSYNNENYLTDSSLGVNTTTSNITDETFNIDAQTDIPPKKKINKHKTNTSDISSNDSKLKRINYVASAENFNKITAKKLYSQREDVLDNHHSNLLVREIPVKESRGMMDISRNKKRICGQKHENTKTFMTKLCSYICKKIRGK